MFGINIEDYMTLWHLQLLIAYILANCALPWYVIWTNRSRLKYDPSRDSEKYLPWIRPDINDWSYIKCVFTHFFFIPRYIGLLTCLFCALIGCLILSCGADIENLGPTRRWLILRFTVCCMHPFKFLFGAITMRSSRASNADYSKWLGPDWKPSYEGATILISNHQSWYDIFLTFLFTRPMPGFIAKHSVKNIPSVGAIATAIGSMYLDRRDKQTRSQIFDLIKERQE